MQLCQLHTLVLQEEAEQGLKLQGAPCVVLPVLCST